MRGTDRSSSSTVCKGAQCSEFDECDIVDLSEDGRKLAHTFTREPTIAVWKRFVNVVCPQDGIANRAPPRTPKNNNKKRGKVD